MDRLFVLQVDAFTRVPFAGNPAGVVPEAAGLTAAQMQAIAREMNLSETAFVLPAEDADLALRFFTPTHEVDLCGHATVAAVHALGERGRLAARARVRTRAGLLEVERRPDGTVWMTQAPLALRDVPPEARAALPDLLGLAPEDLDPARPLVLASTGLWDLLVPVRSRAALFRARPHLSALAEHNRALGVASTHLYTFDPVEPGHTLHARDFSPAVGVPEDPHTGTATGALVAALVRLGHLPPGPVAVEQGWTVGRPGVILAESDGTHVRVGGAAVTVLEGWLRTPPAASAPEPAPAG